MKRHLALFALLTAVLVLPTARAAAQGGVVGGVASSKTAASQPAAGAVLVKVGFETTLVDGKTGASYGWSGGGPGLRIGESVTTGIESGSEDLGGDVGTSGLAVDPNTSHALHVWNVTVHPVAVTGEKITLAVDWKRFDATASGRHELHAGDRRTITLKEGERHVLDFVSAANARPGTAANMMIQVEASLADDPQLKDTTLGYDLWLVDQAPNGQQVTRHIEMAGRQGESIDFRFVPIGWSSSGMPVTGNARPDILIELSGTIKGRLQSNGLVRIAVTPDRSVRISSASGGVRGGTGYRESLLTARPGETIRMDIPLSGSLQGVQGHRTSLTVTVHPW